MEGFLQQFIIIIAENACFFNASMLYYEMLLRFDGRNQKRIAMISFFVPQFRTKVIFINAREMLAFQRAFLKMTLVRTKHSQKESLVETILRMRF